MQTDKNPKNFFDFHYVETINDAFAAIYNENRLLFDNTLQLKKLNELINNHSKILDAGCGTGIPVIKFFIEHGHSVIGTDLSRGMLKLAAKNVPSAQLYNINTINLNFPDQSFDLITSFYSLINIDRDQHRQIFINFHRMLKNFGYAYFTMASESYTNYKEFHGTKIFDNLEFPYSHFDIEWYQKTLEDINFKICSINDINIGGETMTWILVQKIET